MAVQVSGSDLSGLVECERILQVEENAIRVQYRAGKATLRRIAD